MIPSATVEHYKRVQRLQSVGVLAVRRAWRGVDAGALTSSWRSMLPEVLAAVSVVQERAAAAGASYGAATLAAQGSYVLPDSFVDPSGFAGFASDGRPLDGLLYSAVPRTKNLIAAGRPVDDAVRAGGQFLELLAKTQVADAGRSAAGVDIASRVGVGYVRMLNPPSCDRCSLLAGRFYKWNAGFSRHPGCDCVHVPAKGAEAARSEGLMHDPYEYFGSLSKTDQDRVYGKAEAQAIRDGADIFQTVNARRGMKPGGLLTTEGTSRRGNFGRRNRLTPEGIYSQGRSREETLRLLRDNGYILPGGQNPNGVIRSSAAGFSREAGLTAAERRARDARLDWDAVRDGRNPAGGALTPTVAARVEREFRKQILGY